MKINSSFYKVIVDKSSDPIFCFDKTGKYLYVNHAYTTLLKKQKSEIIGKSIWDIFPGDEENKRFEVVEHVLKAGEMKVIESKIYNESSLIYLITSAKPIKDTVGNVNMVLCISKDITEYKKTEQEIMHLSYHDKLTGFYNRRFYEEEIKRIDTERNLPISIIIGDVNGLKLINDAFGHSKGDELLKKAAKAIQSACRIHDIIARWGGDEFVILLPRTETEEAEEIVNRVKQICLNEYVNDINVSISFGWDTKMKIDEDILKVLKSAEDHMYSHKIIEKESLRGKTVSIMINAFHQRNPKEKNHSKRVSKICKDIGKAMGLSQITISTLENAAFFHDIGKIAIEENILNKSEKLTEQEDNEIKRHSDVGYRILSSSYDMLELADYVYAHHERWDGTGYPKGLKGEAIPRISRIIALAESYDEMTSERRYEKTLSKEEVLTIVRNNAGTQFDPEITRVFIEKVLNKRWLE